MSRDLTIVLLCPSQDLFEALQLLRQELRRHHFSGTDGTAMRIENNDEIETEVPLRLSAEALSAEIATWNGLLVSYAREDLGEFHISMTNTENNFFVCEITCSDRQFTSLTKAKRDTFFRITGDIASLLQAPGGFGGVNMDAHLLPPEQIASAIRNNECTYGLIAKSVLNADEVNKFATAGPITYRVSAVSRYWFLESVQ